MTASALLDNLTAAGVSIRVAGPDLKLSPAGALDAAMLAEVRTHKSELIQVLSRADRLHQAPLEDLAAELAERAGGDSATGAEPEAVFYPGAAYQPLAALTEALKQPADRQDDLIRHAVEAMSGDC